MVVVRQQFVTRKGPAVIPYTWETLITCCLLIGLMRVRTNAIVFCIICTLVHKLNC